MNPNYPRGHFCRWAPSLGRLEESSDMVWGTKPYNPDTDIMDPTVFFGLYGLPDFYALWRHKGPKFVFWAGTDIVHFQNGYWLDAVGEVKMEPQPLAEWIAQYCMSYCENEVQARALQEMGILAKVQQSFLGHVGHYEVSYKQAERPSVYSSVSGNNFNMYGWNIIEQIADKCDVDFHLYGNTKEWVSKHSNVFVHGWVPKEQMNDEVKHMQGALRLCMPDGFSEILAKSVLWAQWPITWESFGYKDILGANGQQELIRLLNSLKFKSLPNFEGRDYYRKTLNNFPWNENN